MANIFTVFLIRSGNFSNNLIIQWGRFNNLNLPKTITLPLAVTDISKTALASNTMGGGSDMINSRYFTTTSFDIYGNPSTNISGSWILISY